MTNFSLKPLETSILFSLRCFQVHLGCLLPTIRLPRLGFWCSSADHLKHSQRNFTEGIQQCHALQCQIGPMGLHKGAKTQALKYCNTRTPVAWSLRDRARFTSAENYVHFAIHHVYWHSNSGQPTPISNIPNTTASTSVIPLATINKSCSINIWPLVNRHLCSEALQYYHFAGHSLQCPQPVQHACHMENARSPSCKLGNCGNLDTAMFESEQLASIHIEIQFKKP